MKIHQIRQYEIVLDEDDEFLEYEGRDIAVIKIWVADKGAALVSVSGRHEAKPWSHISRVDTLELEEDSLLKKFLDKLNLMRVDEMTIEQFLAAEEPVG